MTAITGVAAYAVAASDEGVAATPVPAYLAILDPALDRAPTTVTVVMAGLAPRTQVSFLIDGFLAGTAVSDIDGDVEATSVSVDLRFNAGTHVLTGFTATQSASANFTLARSPSAFPVNQGVDADPVYIPGALGENGVYKWVLQDLMPGGLGSWVMPINPASMSNPHVRKNVSARATTAISGRPHLNEGATPLEWEFAGFCPDQEFYTELVAYSELNRRFYIIDHRNRAWTVAIAGLDIRPRKRVRDDRGVNNDWLADYSVKAVLYSQEPKTPVGA